MKAHILVKKALREYPETRDSDRKLMLVVWFYQDRDYKQKFTDFFLNTAHTPETIRRIRQKLQQDETFLANEWTDEARFNKFRKVRGGIAHANAAQTEELISG